MHRSGAAEGDDRVLARVPPLLRQMHARGGSHGLVDDPLHAERRVLRLDPELRRDLVGERPLHAVGIERQLAAEEIGRIEPAQHEIGVRHRRLRAAEAVADRPGFCAGAARARPSSIPMRHRYARGCRRRRRSRSCRPPTPSTASRSPSESAGRGRPRSRTCDPGRRSRPGTSWRWCRPCRTRRRDRDRQAAPGRTPPSRRPPARTRSGGSDTPSLHAPT